VELRESVEVAEVRSASDERQDRPHAPIGSLLEGRRRQVALLAVTSLAGGFAEALFLVLATRAAFAITDGEDEFGIVANRYLSVWTAVALALGLVVARVLLAIIANWQSARLNAAVTARMRSELSSAFLEASWPAQQAERSGRLQELLTTFTARGQELITNLAQGIVSGGNLLALLVSAILVDPVAAIAVIGAVFVLGLVLRPIRTAVKRQARKSAAAGMDFATSLSEVSQLGMEVHVFRVQDEADRQVQNLIERNARVNERLSFLRGMVPAIYTGLAYLALVGALAVVAASDTASLTSLGAVMLVMLRSLSYGQAAQTSVASIISTLPYLDTYEARLQEYRTAKVVDHGAPVDQIGTLELVDVSFSYVPGQPVLHHISATIPPREIVGIIGPSGSGKSTLVQLLLDLRQPTEGRVLSDGRDVRTLSREQWARKVTFVPQQAHLIRGSIADNIRFLRPGVSDEDVERAARLAHLHDDVKAFPEGYQRDVGERGGHLSGGQQQRLCIARALVEQPDVLILDEPTSSLDVRSESLIRRTLDELRSRMTVIIIAHRLSTLDICDRIMVIQDGELKAFDTPANLEQSSDFYREALVLSGLR
jgi:ABC-type multidrug transport system fused ATPase/permease subunit